MTDDPRSIAFDGLPWEDDAPGIRSRATTVGASRWAVVEYGPNASRAEWCPDGHRGWVIAGEIEYEFDDGRPALQARAGEAFRLPEGLAHRGRNLAAGATRLFLIDDPPA